MLVFDLNTEDAEAFIEAFRAAMPADDASGD
jgi:hypothetical protein